MEQWLIRAARLRPERAALVTAERRWSYGELLSAAVGIAGALRTDGVRPGDRVALELPAAELGPALHGCLLAGAAAVPVDLRLRDAERELRRAGAARALRQPTWAATAVPATGERAPAPAPPEAIELDAVATVMFTSGTTAAPKRVELTYGNWLWNAIGSATALGLDPAERWLCPMPLAHVGGLSVLLRSAIYATTVIVHERFDTERVLAALRDPAQRITLVSLVPTMLRRLLEAGLRAPPTLRRVLLGGGPIAPSLLRRAEEAGVPVSPSFGMTETGSQIATDGFPLLGAELSLGEGGELLVRGPSVAPGALAADGWLHTGDLASFDAAGRLQIVGRRGDTIITGGENVAPNEVEATLLAHPAVADAAVLGRPDPEWGETVVAQVVPRRREDAGGGGGSDDAESAAADTAGLAAALRAHCAAELAPFKVPKAIELVAALPRSSTGKLRRRELR